MEAVPSGIVARCGWCALAAVVVLGSVLSAARVSATVIVAKDFAALCTEADLIFVGTVTDVASRWSDPSIQSMETLVTFGNLIWLRGTPEPTVTLRFGGGTVDGLREEFAGVPHFAVGERRVIFAHEGTFVSPIVGFDQGALPVVDSTAGPVVVGGSSVPNAGADLLAGTPTAVQNAPVPLDEFLDRVRQQLASGHAPP